MRVLEYTPHMAFVSINEIIHVHMSLEPGTKCSMFQLFETLFVFYS